MFRAFCALTLVFVLTGCGSAQPSTIEPPPLSDPNMAQITVKRAFRIVGGGSGQTYDIYDYGTGIAYDAEVPALDATSRTQRPTIRVLDAVTDAIFTTQRMYMTYTATPGQLSFAVPKPAAPSVRLVDHFEPWVVGQPLYFRIDQHGGGATSELEESAFASWERLDEQFRADARGDFQRVRFSLLFDAEEQVLYRFILTTETRCNPGLEDMTDKLGSPLGDTLERRFNDAYANRQAAFLVGWQCALAAPFEPELRAQHAGPLPGFDPLTWQRPPGRMQLAGGLGRDWVFAEPIEVEAGRQYVAVFDPNRRAFVVQALP